MEEEEDCIQLEVMKAASEEHIGVNSGIMEAAQSYGSTKKKQEMSVDEAVESMGFGWCAFTLHILFVVC